MPSYISAQTWIELKINIFCIIFHNFLELELETEPFTIKKNFGLRLTIGQVHVSTQLEKNKTYLRLQHCKKANYE